jgi:hypothetical protein
MVELGSIIAEKRDSAPHARPRVRPREENVVRFLSIGVVAGENTTSAYGKPVEFIAVSHRKRRQPGWRAAAFDRMGSVDYGMMGISHC